MCDLTSEAREVRLELGPRSYSVWIGDSLLSRLGGLIPRGSWSTAAVVTDSNVGPLYAERALEVLAQRFAMRVRVVDLESAEGLRLTAAHRPAMSPLVLVDGRFFSAGRLPRKKLAALLERTAVEHPTIEPALPSDVPGEVG